jgi:hypothetical protein
MIITLERGGGVANTLNHQRLGPIDTNDPDSGDRGLVVALLDEVDFFNMSVDWADTRRIFDPMWHSIQVSDADRDRMVKWTDRQEPPEPLREAYRLLASMADWHNV